MNTRKFLRSALGLRGLFPPLLTRTVMTVVLIAPALWAHVETRIIAIADPTAGAQVTVLDRTSLVHGAISGAIPKNANAQGGLPRDVGAHQSSPLERRYQELLAKMNGGSGGGEGSSLLTAFKGFFGAGSSLTGGEGSAVFDRDDGPIGTLGPLGLSMLTGPGQIASERPLAPISESGIVPVGNSSSEPPVVTKPWTTPDMSPIPSIPASLPAPQAWSSASSIGSSSSSSNVSPFSNPISNMPTPSIVGGFASTPTVSSGTNLGFRANSISASPAVSTTTQASSSIVLASIAVPSPTIATQSIPSGVVANSQATPAPPSFSYSFVPVGNAGNANNGTTGLGGVSYNYSIGKYDVTLTQYAAFLTAVASSDPNGLYNTQMAADLTVAGINRTGSSGSYIYTVVGDGQRPITYVSWFDAARLANWMQNGQPSGLGEVAGSTETGAYTLNGATSGVITKNSNATVWIPTESEWYKAAYYDPTLNGGAGGYWQFATQSNTVPGNNAQNAGLANQANYNNSSYSVTQSSTFDPTQNYLTDVGLFANSSSFYKTFDQNGDVYQWTDAVIGSLRGERGGSWQSNVVPLWTVTASDSGMDPGVNGEGPLLGIRLASIPEPTATVSLALAGLLLFVRRKRNPANGISS